MINTILLNKFFPCFFSLLLGQQAETIDIRTCDQAVPKAYPDKGNSHLIDDFIIIFIKIALLASEYLFVHISFVIYCLQMMMEMTIRHIIHTVALQMWVEQLRKVDDYLFIRKSGFSSVL